MKLESRDPAALDGFERLLHLGFNRHEALGVDVGYPFNHLSTDNGLLLRGHNDALDVPVAALAELDEAHLGALYPRYLEKRAHDDRLSNVGFVEGAYFDFFGILAEGRRRGLSVPIVVFGGVILELGGSSGGEFCSTLGFQSLLLRLSLGLLRALL